MSVLVSWLASPLTPEFIQARVEVDTLILNAYEAATLVAKTLDEINAEPQRARAAAHCRQMIISRGGDPTNVVTASGILYIAPPPVILVDTVGAGDTFAGTFTVASASGMPLEGAIRFANVSEALATQVGERSFQFRNTMRSLHSWGGATRAP